MNSNHFTFRFCFRLAVLLPALNIFCMTGLYGQSNQKFRAGLEVGMTSARNIYLWKGNGESSTEIDMKAGQNGFFGFSIEFPVSRKLLLEFAPQYGQRNTPMSTLREQGGHNFTLTQDPVDYLGIPILAKYLFVEGGLIVPYLGAGAEFGMNLTALFVTIDSYYYSHEPPFSTTVSHRRNLNQLYSAVIAEGGLDIRASTRWSVLLGVRFSQELTPLVDDTMLEWETPHDWKLRFALLYTFGDEE